MRSRAREPHVCDGALGGCVVTHCCCIRVRAAVVRLVRRIGALGWVPAPQPPSLCAGAVLLRRRACSSCSLQFVPLPPIASIPRLRVRDCRRAGRRPLHCRGTQHGGREMVSARDTAVLPLIIIRVPWDLLGTASMTPTCRRASATCARPSHTSYSTGTRARAAWTRACHVCARVWDVSCRSGGRSLPPTGRRRRTPGCAIAAVVPPTVPTADGGDGDVEMEDLLVAGTGGGTGSSA